MEKEIYYNLEKDLILTLSDQRRKNPGAMLALFKDLETFQAYLESFFRDKGVDPKLAVFGDCHIVCLDSDNVFFGPKAEKLYVVHLHVIAVDQIVILFNESFSLCELAYRILPEDHLSILPKGTVSQEEISSYGLDYAFASKFVKLAKLKKLHVYTLLNKVEINKLLYEKPITYIPQKKEEQVPNHREPVSTTQTVSGTKNAQGSGDISLRRKKYLGKSDEELTALIKHNFSSDIFEAAVLMGMPLTHSMDSIKWPMEKKIDLLAYLEIVKENDK